MHRFSQTCDGWTDRSKKSKFVHIEAWSAGSPALRSDGHEVLGVRFGKGDAIVSWAAYC